MKWQMLFIITVFLAMGSLVYYGVVERAQVDQDQQSAGEIIKTIVVEKRQLTEENKELKVIVENQKKIIASLEIWQLSHCDDDFQRLGDLRPIELKDKKE
jgi:hypothetical protein